jgi:hypothetical protein
MDDKEFAANQISVLDEFINNNNIAISKLISNFDENRKLIMEYIGKNAECYKDRDNLIEENFKNKRAYYNYKKTFTPFVCD